MKKSYPIIIITVLLLALGLVLAQGYSSNIETQHFESNEISFDYPTSWQQTSAQKGQIIAFKDPQSGLNVTISRQVLPPGYIPPKNLVPDLFSGIKNDFIPEVQQTSTINGNTIYDNLYKINAKGATSRQRELWVQTNGAVYSVVFKYPQGQSNLFSSNTPNSAAIDTVKKSLKIKSTKLATNPEFGTVSIPKLGVKWNIRYDTLNANNGVYHYGKSAYFGLKGTSGLLGHHTLYSAPFNHIEVLKPGDQIIISDYLTQKKYTYQVLSTNDIRYDYKVNKIQFPAGENGLIIGTCWPPGSTAAEIYIHCKLNSVEAIN